MTDWNKAYRDYLISCAKTYIEEKAYDNGEVEDFEYEIISNVIFAVAHTALPSFKDKPANKRMHQYHLLVLSGTSSPIVYYTSNVMDGDKKMTVSTTKANFKRHMNYFNEVKSKV